MTGELHVTCADGIEARVPFTLADTADDASADYLLHAVWMEAVRATKAVREGEDPQAARETGR